MKIAEVMTREVQLATPDISLQEAARMMARDDIGVLPVVENNIVIGMLTDRDIVVRSVAEGRDPAKTRLRDAMSDEVRYCFEDDEIGAAADKMEELKIRRLPIVDRDKRLVGIVSVGNLAHGEHAGRAGETLRSVARPH